MIKPLRCLLFCITSLLFGFLLGGGYGFYAGKQVQFHRNKAYIQRFFQQHQKATVFVSPRGTPVAMVQNGVCYPFPQNVPEIYRQVKVRGSWEPCSYKTIAPYLGRVRANEVLRKEVKSQVTPP